MNKKILSACILSAMVFISCEKELDPIPAKYNTILTLKEFGEKPVTLYNTGDDGDFEFVIFKSGKNPDAVTQAEVQVMDATDLAVYSQKIGRNYVALPSTAYELRGGVLDFTSSERYKKVSVVLKTNDINALITANPTTHYVLPIELKRVKDSVNAEQKLLLLRPRVETPVIQYNEETALVTLAKTDAQTTYEYRLKLPFASPWDFEASVAVDATAPAGYTLVNSSQYALSGSSVAFKKGNAVSEPIVVTVVNGDNAGTKNVVPIKVTSVTKNGVLFPSTPFNLGVEFNKIPLSAGMLSTNAQEPSEGPIAGLVDNNPNTYFHTRWSTGYGSVPHDIKVQLAEPITKLVFAYQNRNNANGKPQEIKVSVSNDGATWTQLALVNSGLPTTASSKYESDVFTAAAPFTHVRLEVMRTNGGAAPIFFSLAELSLYGK